MFDLGWVSKLEISGAGGGSRTLTAIRQTDFHTNYDLHRPHDLSFVVWTIPSP